MSRLLLFVLFVSVLLLGYGAQNSTAQEPNGLETFNGGETYSVAVQDNYAYFAVTPYYETHLYATEISHPIRPFLVGKSPALPDVVRLLAVRGNYAYLVTESAGLRIMDVGDPSTLTEVSAVETNSTAYSLAIKDNYLYLATSGGIHVINIENPLMPQEVAFFDLYDREQTVSGDVLRDIAVSGTHLYLAQSGAGLRILDITEPRTPIELAVYETSNALLVTVEDEYAYLNDADQFLRMIDVSDPTMPTEVGSYAIKGNVRDIVVIGRYAYLAQGSDGIRLVDISSPANPKEVALYETPGTAWGVTVSGNYAYVADGEQELTTIQITDALYTISGQVKNENGNPLPDVTVSAGQEASSITDENGRYTLNLLTGTYRITPVKNGYLFTSRTITLPPDATEHDFNGTLATDLVYLPLLAAPDTQGSWIERVANGKISLGKYQTPLNVRFSRDHNWFVENPYRSITLSRWDWATFSEEPSYSIPITGRMSGRFDPNRYGYGSFYQDNLIWHPASTDFAAIISSDSPKSTTSVQLWNRATGEELDTLPYPDSVHNIAYSPDSRWLAVATGPQVHIYDATTRQLIHTLSHQQDVYHLVFSPDGEWLVTSQTELDEGAFRVGTFHLWHVPTAQERFQLIDEPMIVDSSKVIFASDSQHFTIPLRNKVWNVAHAQPVIESTQNGAYALSLFSPNGRFFVYRETNFEVVWDTSIGQETTRIPLPLDLVPLALRFSPDGQKLVISGARRIMDEATSTEIGWVPTTDIWDTMTGELLLQLDFGEEPISSEQDPTHRIWVDQLAFSPNGNWLLTGDRGGRIRVWDSETGQQMFQLEYDPEHHPFSYLSPPLATFAPDGAAIMATGLEGIKIWYPEATQRPASSSFPR